MKAVSKKKMEATLVTYLETREQYKQTKDKMDKLRKVIDTYCAAHLDDFDKNNYLTLDSGKINMRKGVATPIRDGEILDTENRLKLATKIPKVYTRTTCDFEAIYKALRCQESDITEALSLAEVEIHKPDVFVVYDKDYKPSQKRSKFWANRWKLKTFALSLSNKPNK